MAFIDLMTTKKTRYLKMLFGALKAMPWNRPVVIFAALKFVALIE